MVASAATSTSSVAKTSRKMRASGGEHRFRKERTRTQLLKLKLTLTKGKLRYERKGNHKLHYISTSSSTSPLFSWAIRRYGGLGCNFDIHEPLFTYSVAKTSRKMR